MERGIECASSKSKRGGCKNKGRNADISWAPVLLRAERIPKVCTTRMFGGSGQKEDKRTTGTPSGSHHKSLSIKIIKMAQPCGFGIFKRDVMCLRTRVRRCIISRHYFLGV